MDRAGGGLLLSPARELLMLERVKGQATRIFYTPRRRVSGRAAISVGVGLGWARQARDAAAGGSLIERISLSGRGEILR